jgi:hypothetical protein
MMEKFHTSDLVPDIKTKYSGKEKILNLNCTEKVGNKLFATA